MRPTAKNVRASAVAGTFYPATRARLLDELDTFLAEAHPTPGRPKAVVVPHAGYVYSGAIAGSAYALVEQMEPKPTRVVLLGPGHYVAFDGLALPEASALDTPLGTVPVDEGAAEAVARLPQVMRSDFVHEREHSLEVQLPFLQRVLGQFLLLPFAVGRASAAEVSQVLDAVWGGPETLLVVSTDLSHYLPYDEAKALDSQTAEHVTALDFAGIDSEAACGSHALKGLLLSARRHALEGRLLDLRSSGDTAGDKKKVVGYGAFAFFEKPRLSQ